MSRANLMVKSLLSVALALVFWGCTTSTNEHAPSYNQSGEHPATWLKDHWVQYFNSPGQCQTCHGSATDPKLAGGISKVSCFTCHPNGPGHQAGFAAADKHGRASAMAAASSTTGFAYCAKCHGAKFDFTVGTMKSCMACHTKAPHPDKPWTGTTLDKPNHNKVDLSNAPECFKCHANGANSHIVPSAPAPSGTAPGCYNNTLCHGTYIP